MNSSDWRRGGISDSLLSLWGLLLELTRHFLDMNNLLSLQLLSYKNVHLIVLFQHLCRSPPLLALQSSLSVRYPNGFLRKESVTNIR